MMQQPISVHDLRKIQVINDPQMAPDGETIAFVRQFITEEDDYISHLFLQKTTDVVPTQWTFGHGKVMSPRFSPNGQWIAFTSVRGTYKTPQLYLQSLFGGEAKRVTDLPNGASQLLWSPDSTKILFTTSFQKGEKFKINKDEFPEKKDENEKSKPLVVERLKYKSDATGFLDSKKKQLVLYHLSTDKIECLTDDEYDHDPTSWSPNGDSISYFSNKQGS